MEYSNSSNSLLCFWDKHKFTGDGVRCPLKYNPKQIVHKKREYYIHENVCEDTITTEVVDVCKTINSEIIYTDMFCSNNCLLSWIDEMHYNPEYSQSKIIFTSEFYKQNNRVMPKKAPHWRILKVFGGFLTIDEFRQGNNIYNLIEKLYIDNEVKYVFDKKINVE